MISEREKQKIQQIAETLPDTVIVPEDESQKGGEVLSEETMHVLGVSHYGETGKSTRQLTGAISEHVYKLFAALTNNNSPPDESDDLIVAYIKPSREFRKGLMLEVNRDRRTEIHNVLHYVSVAIEEMIETINEIDNDKQ